MYYLKDKYLFKNEIDKSKFISILLPLNSKDDCLEFLSSIKKEYPKATHYVYAYKIDKEEKCSDDGEPNKTAGRPTLDAINKKEFNNVLLVTIRYFGGKKLGSGRLLRTYLANAVSVLEMADKYVKEEYFVYNLELKINFLDIIKKFCVSNNIIIKKINYNIDMVIVEVSSPIILDITSFINIDIKIVQICRDFLLKEA